VGEFFYSAPMHYSPEQERESSKQRAKTVLKGLPDLWVILAHAVALSLNCEEAREHIGHGVCGRGTGLG